MKLTKALLGKKIKRTNWPKGDYYYLFLAITSKGSFIGEDEKGRIIVIHIYDDEMGAENWKLCEKAKKSVLRAPRQPIVDLNQNTGPLPVGFTLLMRKSRSPFQMTL